MPKFRDHHCESLYSIYLNFNKGYIVHYVAQAYTEQEGMTKKTLCMSRVRRSPFGQIVKNAFFRGVSGPGVPARLQARDVFFRHQSAGRL